MRSILWLLAVTSLNLAHGQDLVVYDQETGKYLPSVTVICEELSLVSITDSLGQVNLSSFVGASEIEFSRMGYLRQVRSFAELEKANFELRLFLSGLSLDDVVVKATRIQQDARDVPALVSSVRQEFVTLQNPQTSADLLGSSGKVFIQKSQQGGGSPMIRGFATNRLMYAVDGVRMNTAIFRSGNIQNVISIDPFSLDKTDIYFGPGSVIYGSDAIGGVINFETKKPSLSKNEEHLLGGSAVLRYSSANSEKTGHFDLNFSGRKVGGLLSITTTNFGDLKMGSNGPEEYLRPFYVSRINDEDQIVENENKLIQVPTGYSQFNLMQKIRFSPNHSWDLNYGFHYSKTSEFDRYDRHIRLRNGLPRYGDWKYGPQVWLMNNLQANYIKVHALFDMCVLRFAQQIFEESRISRNIHDPLEHNRKEKVDAYSINVDFTKNFQSDNRVYYGIEGVINNVKSIGTIRNIETIEILPGPSRYPQADWASFGIYFNYQKKMSDRLSFQVGTRYNVYTLDALFDNLFYPLPFKDGSINHGALTGSMGLVHRPHENTSLNVNLATAYRAPNVDDVGKIFDSEPGAVVVPNPDLEAEYAYNAEIGLSQLVGDLVKIDVTAYYTILNNALVRRDFELEGRDSIIYDGTLSRVQAVQNAASASVFGIQAGIEVEITESLCFLSDINFQNGEEESDDGSSGPLRHAPPFFGISRLTFSKEDLKLEINAAYNGKASFDDLPQSERAKTEIYAIDDQGRPWSPSWYTINLKATYSITDNISIQLGLENITDQRYRTYSSGIAAAGRNLVVSVRGNI